MPASPRPAKAAPFVISFFAEILMAGAMQGILFHSGMHTLRAGIISGALMLARLRVHHHCGQQRLSGPPFMLTVIDSGHWLGVLVIIGGIVGYFRAVSR